MKTANRKMLLSLLGIAVATPFLVIALVLGARATAIAHSLQGDLLLVVLVLASFVASIGEGRLVLKREAVLARHDQRESEEGTELSAVSTLNHVC